MRQVLALSAAAGVIAMAGSALAHHGWSWAEADQIELTGTIRSLSFAPPHPTLQLATADGEWRIELGNPNQTQRSGFVEGVAKAGDEVTVLGNRSLDPEEKRLKAVRVTLADKNYDIYPTRIQTN
ncbi:DUF6152 family protein [Pseudomonas sp. R2.Fl]|nr:DUF6152 family protein [Pseudomonas sp. R2.Fl]